MVEPCKCVAALLMALRLCFQREPKEPLEKWRRQLRKVLSLVAQIRLFSTEHLDLSKEDDLARLSEMKQIFPTLITLFCIQADWASFFLASKEGKLSSFALRLQEIETYTQMMHLRCTYRYALHFVR